MRGGQVSFRGLKCTTRDGVDGLDEQVALKVAFHHAQLGVFVAGSVKVVEDIEDGAKEDEFSLFNELVANGLCEMAFADSGRANQEDILGLGGKVSGGQLVNLLAIDGGIEGEAEAVEGALFAEGGGLVTAVEEALAAVIELILQGRFKEPLMGELTGLDLLQAQVQARPRNRPDTCCEHGCSKQPILKINPFAK